ncbi:oligopeptide ABC transporter substrate-binding protein [Staphylococcus epidermidis]|uniref:oligopeptide ABC transporter substrate-binding protein n=1 Tax=Staphylococcus epidermidis TaxID=1282 RepID=UPI00024E12CA|nr:oligopeptide ABC transporter substrate-binding protein [Staphylococcus epidermidis]EHR86306.1 ABC transporter, substrate-binding protein, family 5 [Staphylococcus epidermidis VCU118]
MKKCFKYLTLLLVIILVLSGCGKEKPNDNNKDASKTDTSDHKGGTLKVGMPAAPSGVYSSILSSDHSDATVEGYFNEGLIKVDKKVKPKSFIASWKDIDPGKKIEFKIKKGIKWHDGNELTIDDWIYTLEVLANKDYSGSYYPSVENIKGAKEMHNGEADHLIGIKKKDKYTMEVTFDKKKVNYLTGFISGPLLSKKYLSDVPVKDLAKSDKIRKHPIGIGPYKVKKIVQGEAIQLERFNDYWQGKPSLEKIELKVIDQPQMIKALEKGDIDLVNDATAPMAKEAKKSKENIKVLSTPSLEYAVIGFVSHDYDKAKNKTGKVRPKYENKELRQALMYAIDRKKWINAFFNGYGSEINSYVPSTEWIAADSKDLNDYKYNPEKAKKILDKLGYKDKDGDGFREDPNGKPFVINLKHYAGSNPTFEPRTAAIKDFWEKVGLKTKVKLVEFGKYNDDLANASKDIEVYFRSWTGGTDPDPSDLYHTDRPMNEMRTVLPKSDKLLDEALDFDKVGKDEKKRKDLYVQWQKYMNEELPALPMLQMKSISIVNDKIRNYDIEIGNDKDLYQLTKID